MSVAYVNTSPQSAIAQFPRAVYRISLQRQGIASLVMAAGVVSWPSVVESVADAAARAPYAVALGYSPPGVQDSTAIIEVRAESGVGISDSVGDLARVLDTASSFARVTRIERLPPVPVAGSQEERDRTASRQAAEVAATQAAQESGILAKLKGALGTGKIVGGAIAGAALILGLLWLIGRARSGAPIPTPGGE